MEPVLTDEMIAEDHILAYFEYKHLPPHLQTISAPFAHLAILIHGQISRSPERTVCFRKLLEAKDCAVRAAIG